MGGMAENSQRRAGLPRQRCTAKSKQSGERCQKWATVGASVCHSHGGAKRSVKERGDLQVVAAQLGLLGLPPAETVRVIQRVLSERMVREAETIRDALERGEQVDADAHQRWEQIADKALVSARVALSAGIEEQNDAARQDLVDTVGAGVRLAMDAVMRALPGGLKYWNDLHDYAMAMIRWALAPEDERGSQPELPADPPQHLMPGYVHPTTYYGPGTKPPAEYGSAQSPAVAELLPAPRRRPVDADDVWRRASAIVDAELVEDQDEGEVDDGDEGGIGGEAA
jgi:hypothetical protein